MYSYYVSYSCYVILGCSYYYVVVCVSLYYLLLSVVYYMFVFIYHCYYLSCEYVQCSYYSSSSSSSCHPSHVPVLSCFCFSLSCSCPSCLLLCSDYSYVSYEPALFFLIVLRVVNRVVFFLCTCLVSLW